MGRVLGYWMALGTIAAATTYGATFLVFGQIDLSFLTFAAVLCAPLLQAMVLVWRSEPRDAVAVVVRSVLAHPLAAPVLVLDGFVLGAGIVWWDTHVVGLGAPVNIHSTWTLVKGVAALGFFAAAVLRAGGRQRAASVRLVIGPMLLMFALDPSTSWLAAAFAHVHGLVGPGGEVFQRLALYGALFSLVIAGVLRTARRVSVWSSEAGALLHAAVAAAVLLAMVVILAIFNLPVLTQPWLGVAELSASAANTCVLLAAILLASTER
jgi:hypothetical protein